MEQIRFTFLRRLHEKNILVFMDRNIILDGASLLVAYKNAGGNIDIDNALEKLMSEGLRMPGAMCGLWGICGAITSIGAALSIIDEQVPLSTDGTWGNHMQFTSNATSELGKINGPRCCKRDAMIAFKNWCRICE